jgi:hypothetical protein
MSDEEEARMVFDELRGSRDVLPLVEFLKWEDVQELLDCGALSKDKLAEAIVAAFANPANAGKGALKVGGKMAELLHRDLAERLLAKAATIDAANTNC